MGRAVVLLFIYLSYNGGFLKNEATVDGCRTPQKETAQHVK